MVSLFLYKKQKMDFRTRAMFFASCLCFYVAKAVHINDQLLWTPPN